MRICRLAASALFISLGGAVGAAHSGELLVPQQYPTIQAAVDAAFPGATIVVAPGTYRENIAVVKSLRLRSSDGAKQTILDGGQVGPVIVGRGTGTQELTIDGFTITNGFDSAWLPTGNVRAGGIHLDSMAGVITGNVITGNVGCLGLGVSTYAASVTIVGNEIVDNRQDSSCNGATGGGIFLLGDGARPSLVAGI